MTRVKQKTKQYLEDLQNDPYWQRVRHKILIRDNFTCQISGKKTMLSVHHIAYTVNGVDIRGKELQYLDWLITLNQDVHEQVHKNNGHALNPGNACKINAVEFKKRNFLN